MDKLETRRLLLRPWRIEDAEDMFAYAKCPEVGPNAGWKPHESVEESEGILKEWISGNSDGLIWALEDKESHKVIGSVGLHEDGHRTGVPDCRMLGYVLSKEFWGKGLMTEAANAAMEYAFGTLKVKLLSVQHFAFNQRSKRVIEKCGFHYEGKLRRISAIYDGTVVDECFYSMTPAEYYLLRAREAGLSLRLPEEISKQEFLAYQQGWTGERMIPTGMCLKEQSYEDWLQDAMHARSAAPEGFVTATGWLLTDKDGVPVGAVHLRHTLNQNLLETGGHIGYGIRPASRGKGMAPMMLALGLEKAGEHGIEKVLMTCNDDNGASAATIEACGGVLENTVLEENGNTVRRYWISL